MNAGLTLSQDLTATEGYSKINTTLGVYDLEPSQDNQTIITKTIENNFKEPWWLNYSNTYSNTHSFGGAANYTAGVVLPNSNVLMIPASSNHDLGIYNPNDDTFSTLGISLSVNNAFAGGVLAPNGKVILVPNGSSSPSTIPPIVGIYDPDTNTYTNGPTVPNIGRFIGGVLAPNGKVIFAPRSQPTIGIYDPVSNTYTNGPAHGQNNSSAYWGAVLAPNGKVILVPGDSEYVGIYDPIANTFTQGPAHGESGAGTKYTGGVVAPNGKVIFAPRDAAHIGIYDPITNTFTRGPAHGEGFNAFYGGVLAPNGKVILVPDGRSSSPQDPSEYIGIYDPIANTYTRGPTHGQALGSFRGGVLAPNGKVILVPYKSTAVGVYGSEFPLKNSNDTLSPYFNKY